MVNRLDIEIIKPDFVCQALKTLLSNQKFEIKWNKIQNLLCLADVKKAPFLLRT